MKTVGNTIDGKFLVEMTVEEHGILKDLSGVIDGRPLRMGDWKLSGIERDLSSSFKVIKEFIETVSIINALRGSVEDLEALVGIEKEVKNV